MKVVKCLEHIDKRFWGKVVEDSSDFKPSDTFPLPTQGDKVEVSHNGNDFINIREYRALADSIFICKNEHGKYEVWQYIRPIEQASAAVGTSSTTCISEADETLLALRDIQKDLHEIFEYLKDN